MTGSPARTVDPDGSEPADSPSSVEPRRTARTGSRASAAATLLLLAIVAVAWFPREQGPLDIRWDAGAYYVLGTSLAEGKGFRLLNEPGEPRAIQYPPGLPALVAVHQKLAGTSDWVVVGRHLRITYSVIAMALAVLTLVFLRQFLPLWVAWLATLLAVFLPATGDSLTAEEPFALVVLLFTIFALREGPRAQMAAGTLGVLAFFIRTAGIVVLIAWAIDAALRRQWRSFGIRALVAAIPLAAWQGYVRDVQQSEEYRNPAYEYQRAPYLFNNVSYVENLRLADPFRPELGTTSTAGVIARSIRLLPRLPESLGRVISTGADSWLHLLSRGNLEVKRAGVRWKIVRLAFISIGLIALAGVGLLAWRRQYLIALLLLGTIAVVCITPWTTQWPRYLGPMTTHFVLAMVLAASAGAGWLAGRLFPSAPRTGDRLLSGVLVGLIMVQAVGIWRAERHSRHRVEFTHLNGRRVTYQLYNYEQRHRDLDEALDWLIPRTRNREEVIVSTMPFRVHLRTGLRSVLPPASGDSAEVLRLLDGIPATYLLKGESRAIIWAEELVNPVIASSPDRWELIHDTPGGTITVYQRTGSGTRDTSSTRMTERPPAAR